MRKTAWAIVLALIAFLYTASSIPGLQVLPVLRQLNRLAAQMDVTFVRLAEWLAGRIPLNFGELAYIDTVTQDFLAYVRENPVVIEFFLRKMAHVAVFFVLTLALFFLLYQYIARASVAVLLSFAGGFVLAVLDEYRQSFVPGRVASPVDVFVDMIGVTLAVLLIVFALVLTSGQRRQFFPVKELKSNGKTATRIPQKLKGTYRKNPEMSRKNRTVSSEERMETQ